MSRIEEECLYEIAAGYFDWCLEEAFFRDNIKIWDERDLHYTSNIFLIEGECV